MARSFCCSAPLETYYSQGKPTYWVCRLCEMECLEDGTQSPGWRVLGNNPYNDIDLALSMVKRVLSFESGLNARRCTIRSLTIAQRQAFIFGALWREHNPIDAPGSVDRENQSERMFPMPEFPPEET